MGQAKQRKAEIAKLKANGKITPFIIRGSIVDGKVVYDTAGLEPAQVAFVNGCVTSINEHMVPELAETPTQATHLTMVSWINSEDFMGGLMGPFIEGNTPDSIWAENEMAFNKHQSPFPQVGFIYTRDEMIKLGAGVDKFYDLLSEGGIWPWPNARAVFEKRGDKLVVIDTI
jgi:hypothetical protein